MQTALWRGNRSCGLASLVIVALMGTDARADISLPNVFSNHMILQSGQRNKVWGTGDAGEVVTVTIDGQVLHATTDAGGKWQVMLGALAVGGPYTLTVNGKNEVKCEDVLAGEVWICSGQSNMRWNVNRSNNADLTRLSARFPKIRLLNYPSVGSQTPIWTHDRKWMVCSPAVVGDFSAVGYFFGRELHSILEVPIGIINNAWSGSACEAWIRRDLLVVDEKYGPLLDCWTQKEARCGELSGKSDLSPDQQKQLDALRSELAGFSRPANIYNGVLKSHIGYGIRGVIWYQGEGNIERAYQYRELFPLMIKNWRDDWGQGDFPFYWAQLANCRSEKPEPSNSAWAELREAQTMTMAKLPHTGEAVTIDLGEAKNVHPMNKLDVGIRLARWALANDYGVKVPFHSPQYKSIAKAENKLILSFDHVDGGWRPFGVHEPRGFAVAGNDNVFVWATGKILPDGRIEVASDKVLNPVSVRYGWADNPVVNMYNGAGLPLTPFRTDDLAGVTINAK